MKHPSIVEYIDHIKETEIEGSNGEGVYIITEFVDGGTLRKLLKQPSVKNDGLPEVLVLKLFKQLVDGFAYMHEMGIVHRDIKPENILLF